jgi:tight adherence protein B
LTALPHWMLAGVASLFLVGFGVAGLLVSQAQLRRQQQARRIETVVAPFRRTAATRLRAFRAAPGANRSLMQATAAIFGFNPAHADQYPCKWWVPLAVASVGGWAVANFAVDAVGPVGLAALPLVGIGGCRAFFGWVLGRRQRTLLEQFPDALAMIVRSVRVGIPVLGAMRGVAEEAPVPTCEEFARLGGELAVGVPLDQAAADLAARVGMPEYRFFATAIGLQAQTGGGLSETLENLADLIRKRIALRQRGHALSSEARTSALMLGALPIVMGGGLSLLNPGYMALLFRTSLGQTILAVAAGSLACGGLVMRSIIKRSLS